MKYFWVLISLYFLFLYNGVLQAQWVPTNSIFGGIIRCMAVSGTNLFVGTRFGGVFLSTNNGTSWTAVNNGLTNSQVYAIAVRGTNIFAGT